MDCVVVFKISLYAFLSLTLTLTLWGISTQSCLGVGLGRQGMFYVDQSKLSQHGHNPLFHLIYFSISERKTVLWKLFQIFGKTAKRGKKIITNALLKRDSAVWFRKNQWMLVFGEILTQTFSATGKLASSHHKKWVCATCPIESMNYVKRRYK